MTKEFEPFWTNHSEGRVRERLLSFGPKFYPSEERGRKESAKIKLRRKEKKEGWKFNPSLQKKVYLAAKSGKISFRRNADFSSNEYRCFHFKNIWFYLFPKFLSWNIFTHLLILFLLWFDYSFIKCDYSSRDTQHHKKIPDFITGKEY